MWSPVNSMQTPFPADIKLDVPPLGEAWLEIRWQLKPMGPPGLLQDPDFPFALGAFYALVKDRYPSKKDLAASQAPLEILPHVVRHQFWRGDTSWPILQLGPGVASVNFTRPYSWADFKSEALYLRSKLLSAYSSGLPQLDVVILRYLNAEPFEFSDKNVLEYLRSHLNTTLSLPPHVPGSFSGKPHPTSLHLQLSFDLQMPKGSGAIVLATGARPLDPDLTQPSKPTNVAIWQLEVASGGTDAPVISDEPRFSAWLDAAHSAIHEWFFSFIDGTLRAQYSSQKG